MTAKPPSHPAPGTEKRPVIGITADATTEKFQVGRAYAQCVAKAGGTPLILPCIPGCAGNLLALCHGIIFTGGDDPDMARWGITMHPKATPLDADRQAFELALLDLLDHHPATPVLGICLGMQLMGLHAGGTLEQYLPDVLPTAADHWDRRTHEVHGELGRGRVQSHHRQALSDPGRLRVVAAAHDGVIEAVSAPERPFYLGVQWHPERTEDAALGFSLVRRLVDAARAHLR